MPAIQRRKVVFFFCVFLASSASAEAAEIVLRGKCACGTGYVRLGDVAEIRGVADDVVQQLGRIPLIPAPPRGAPRVLRVREIQELLELRGVDLYEIQISGASRVEVSAEAVPATGSSPPTAAAQPPRQKAVVALRALPRGTLIQSQDVALGEIPDRAADPSAALTDITRVIGTELTRAVVAGQAIRDNELRRPLLVERNRAVQLVARIGGVEVRRSGKALDAGASDDLVRVELDGNRGKQVTGRVVGIDEVEIVAQPASVAANPPPAPATSPSVHAASK